MTKMNCEKEIDSIGIQDKHCDGEALPHGGIVQLLPHVNF